MKLEVEQLMHQANKMIEIADEIKSTTDRKEANRQIAFGWKDESCAVFQKKSMEIEKQIIEVANSVEMLAEEMKNQQNRKAGCQI